MSTRTARRRLRIATALIAATLAAPGVASAGDLRGENARDVGTASLPASASRHRPPRRERQVGRVSQAPAVRGHGPPRRVRAGPGAARSDRPGRGRSRRVRQARVPQRPVTWSRRPTAASRQMRRARCRSSSPAWSPCSASPRSRSRCRCGGASACRTEQCRQADFAPEGPAIGGPLASLNGREGSAPAALASRHVGPADEPDQPGTEEPQDIRCEGNDESVHTTIVAHAAPMSAHASAAPMNASLTSSPIWS